MASPTIVARAEGNAAGAQVTTVDVTFTQTTGDQVVFYVATTASKDVTVSDSFTRLSPTGSATSHVYAKILDGSEGGTCTVSWTTSTRVLWLSWNIQGHSTTQAPEVSTIASGTDTTPNPGTVTPTGGAKDYLWIAAFQQNGEEADDDTWCTAAPTSFGNLVQKTTGAAGLANTNRSGAAANFASNAASMDPATFTVAQSLPWTAYTVAVHPAAAGAAANPPYHTPYPQLLAH